MSQMVALHYTLVPPLHPQVRPWSGRIDDAPPNIGEVRDDTYQGVIAKLRQAVSLVLWDRQVTKIHENHITQFFVAEVQDHQDPVVRQTVQEILRRAAQQEAKERRIADLAEVSSAVRALEFAAQDARRSMARALNELQDAVAILHAKGTASDREVIERRRSEVPECGLQGELVAAEAILDWVARAGALVDLLRPPQSTTESE